MDAKFNFLTGVKGEVTFSKIRNAFNSALTHIKAVKIFSWNLVHSKWQYDIYAQHLFITVQRSAQYSFIACNSQISL